MSYETLFSRCKIGGLTLRNRIVMPAMGTSFAEITGEAGERIIQYYEARARGGCGLIITEITRVDELLGPGLSHQLSASSPRYIKSLKTLTQSVQRHGCAIFLQLQHPGRAAAGALMDGREAIGPSALPDPAVGTPTRAMTKEEIKDVIGKFVMGAYVAKAAGFDGLEIHGAHGYLLDQFLSPYSNKRTDEYGGSLENRMRFLTEIIAGVRQTCGRGFPLSVRLSADEFVEGGLTIEDGVEIAGKLEALGVDAINVSCGVYASGHTCIEPASFAEGWKKHLGAAVKAAVSIPVIATNNIKRPSIAETLLQENVCDFVAVGRGQLCDPEWAEKARTGAETAIYKCIGCLNCFNELGLGNPLVCTVNPLLGREHLYNETTLKRDGEGRTVAVVGGGPAGMWAAIVLAKRGFRPVIFEQGGELGGTLNIADKPPHKTLMTEFVRTLCHELNELAVEVRMNTQADPENIRKLKPYGVILAAGGTPLLPPVPGIGGENVCTAEQVLSGQVKFSGKRVAVIGGGVTGLETAEFLGGTNSVTVVEMLDDVGTSLYITAKLTLLARLAEQKVTVKTGHQLTEIRPGEILLQAAGQAVTEPCDQVVLALGVVPRSGLVEAFDEAFERVLSVGDVYRAGMIVDAMTRANDCAWVL